MDCYLVHMNPTIGHTLVLGASTNPSRYSYLAIERLRAAEHPVLALGTRTGKVGDVIIHTDWKELDGISIDTITLYIGPDRQTEQYDRILSAKPQRIIFNPGTENPQLEQLAIENGIQPLQACTLVMLSTNQY